MFGMHLLQERQGYRWAYGYRDVAINAIIVYH